MQLARALRQLASPVPSFDEIVADHLPMVRRIAAAHESNPTLQEDLIQEILCAVWRALPQFRGDGDLRGFIARIAANRAVTHVQRALRAPESSELTNDFVASGADPEAQAMIVDDKEGLLRALRALPIGLREPALLALEGLTQQQIAGVLGVTPNAVAIRMTRARSHLRKLLGG